jgi:hypothetical protein
MLDLRRRSSSGCSARGGRMPLLAYLCEVSSSVRGAQCFMLHTERGSITRGMVNSVPQPVGAAY